ncbi:c-type cytochrome [Pseudidiomarina terrestris]|uniref:c-type cytochrome n=1 Tax=Pseudidiomarina terrestris TaxID=2820060 RepID=UPI002655E2A1|nr:cytochrome c [Pseudidiomarina sp. 1ASP75-5]MDN7136252.1 c-type cytochrome [Pseudidiomarina sp. 1ASP75-5]
MGKLHAIKAIFICSLTTLFSMPVAADESKELIKHGDYLVNHVMACGHCHGKDLAGGTVIPEDFGNVYVPNITPHKATGIGHWSHDDIIHALRNGRRPDGSVIGIPMPIEMYKNLSDDDAKAIAAYLLSRPPIERATPASDYPDGFLQRVDKSRQPMVTTVAAIDYSDPMVRGDYVATQAHCFACHTPWHAQELIGAGGNPLPVAENIYIYSKNITPAGPVGGYSDQQLEHVLRTGELPDGSKLHEMMPAAFYAEMSPADMSALIAYLRSLPPVTVEHKRQGQP